MYHDVPDVRILRDVRIFAGVLECREMYPDLLATCKHGYRDVSAYTSMYTMMYVRVSRCMDV